MKNGMPVYIIDFDNTGLNLPIICGISQRVTYEIVLDTVHHVVRQMKPGFTWREARIVTYKELLGNTVKRGTIVVVQY